MNTTTKSEGKMTDCEHNENDISIPEDRGEKYGATIETCLDCGEILNNEIESE